jgi:hypothetical protein
MNWEAVAAIAEVAGTVGVIASVLYLSGRIGHNTRQMRIAVHGGTTRNFREFTRQTLAGGYSKVFPDGLEDFESLDGEAKLDFAFLMFGMFKAFENVYYHYLHGSMAEDAWLAWKRLLTSYAVAPGAQQDWKIRREVYTTEFRKLVDELDSEGDFKRVGHVRQERPE